MNLKAKTSILLSAVLALCALSFTAAVRTQYFGSARSDANGLWLGQASTDKVALRGKAPVVLPSSANQDALTDSTGGSVANATLADGLTTTALTDNSGGAAADGTIGAVTAPTALTDSSGGTASGTLAAIAAAGTYADDDDAIKNAIASLAARQAEDRTAIVALTDAIKELSTQVNLLIADDATQNSNDAKLAELVNALRTAGVTQGLWRGAAAP